ncbi:uncharacterized protein LOC144921007 [Branchiostoma floridae x Branchiostoma belcheri]
MGWAFMLFPFLLSLFAPSIRKPSYSRFVSRWDAAWRPQRFGRDPSRVPRSDPYPYGDLQRWLERKQQQQPRPFGAGTFRDNQFDPGPVLPDLKSQPAATWGKERFLSELTTNQRYGKFASPLSNLLGHRLVQGSSRPFDYGRQAAVVPYRKTLETLMDMVQNRLIAELLQRLWNQHQGQGGNGASLGNGVVQPGRFPTYGREAEYGSVQSPQRDPSSSWGVPTSSRPYESAGKDKVKWSRPKVILSKMATSGGRQPHASKGPPGNTLHTGHSGGISGNSLNSGHSGGTSGNSLYSGNFGGPFGNSLYSGHSAGTSGKNLYSMHSGGPSGNSLYAGYSGGPSGSSLHSGSSGGTSGKSPYSGYSGGPSGNSLYSRPSGGASGNSLYPGPSGHSKQPGNPESNAIYPLVFRKTREAGNRKMH